MEIEQVCKDSDLIMNLLSDASQKALFSKNILPHLTKNKTLCYSHGFSVIFKDQTKVEIPKEIDVIMVASKGYSLLLFIIYIFN